MKQLALNLAPGSPTAPPRALARSADPATSHRAAASMEARLPSIEGLVLARLRQVGAAGLTVDELVDVLRLDKVTISPRLKPLCKKNLVTAGASMRPGKSGRQQTVWVAL